jgi:alkylmercury lyase
VDNARAVAAAKRLTADGGPLDYGPDRSRLLVRVQRTLAQGRPVTNDEAGRLAAGIGVAQDEADRFLRTVTERDEADNIVGALGLSLNDHPHRVTVNGTQLSAWCAADTLFLPAVLQQSAAVESVSPFSGQTVRLSVSPHRVEAVSPAGAVVSMVVIDLDEADTNSVEAIWGIFCHQIYFFASREEGERWAAGRASIAILSVDEAYDAVRPVASRLLASAS